MIFQARLCDEGVAHELAAQALALPGWQDGAQSAGKDIRDRKRNRQLFALPEDIRTQIVRAMSAQAAVDRVGPAHIGDPRISAYGPGEHYGWHVDSSLVSPQVRTDVSMSLILLRAEAGGNVHIRVGDVELELAPEAGEAVFWASHLEHSIAPVERGLRVVAISGLRCQIPDPIVREVLCRMVRMREHVGKAAYDDYAFALNNLHRYGHRG